MKKLFVFMMLVGVLFTLLGLSACSKKEVKVSTAEDLINDLKDAKLSIDEVIVFTAEDDPNNLLGRPGQYITKVNFSDSRLDQTGSDDPVGGSIETFSSASDLNDRKEYLEKAFKKIPALTEYLYINDKYLLRVNGDLTPDQAKEYEDAFMKL